MTKPFRGAPLGTTVLPGESQAEMMRLRDILSTSDRMGGPVRRGVVVVDGSPLRMGHPGTTQPPVTTGT